MQCKGNLNEEINCVKLLGNNSSSQHFSHKMKYMQVLYILGNFCNPCTNMTLLLDYFLPNDKILWKVYMAAEFCIRMKLAITIVLCFFTLEIISIYYRYGAKELAKTYISSTIMPISLQILFHKASKNFSNQTYVSCSLLILGCYIHT
jgi:hypothetical protein